MNKIKQDIVRLLKQDERLWDEENKQLDEPLLKKLIDCYDEKIIDLLLSDKTIREKFFIKSSNAYMFKSNDFKFFIDENQLDNSYTQFENKIGLKVGSQLLRDCQEVVLNWAYKDCILEGGQSTEQGIDEHYNLDSNTGKFILNKTQRKEIFYNEVLALDEIDRLFESKALNNFYRYTTKGEEKVKTIIRDKEGQIKDNLIIKGNNLLTLHSLQKEFKGRIKLIYIDPPYNTKGDSNTFAYNNSFNHSTWLTFMKNRLEASKILLNEDGVVCITIDDEEYAHLKLLCDEIFDRENYIGTIIIQSNPRGRTTNAHFATCHEYALFYAKDILNVNVNLIQLTKEQELDFDMKDSDGEYRLLPFRRSGGTSTPEERPNSYYPIYYSIEKKTFSLEKKAGYNEIYPIDKLGKKRVWRQTRPSFLEAVKRGDMVCKKSNNKLVIYMKDRMKEGRRPKTIWTDSKYDASANGTMLLKSLFKGEKLFSYPKSLYAVKDVLDIFTQKSGNDIVLDFFAGSGTTAHAVLELNKEDKGNRQYILCEQMNYIKKVTVERVKKCIKEIGESSFIYCELAEFNEGAKELINSARNHEQLIEKFNDICIKYFLNYNLQILTINKLLKENEFKSLDMHLQKKILTKMLDLNQMYVNYSEIEDKKYGISKEDQKLSKMFYGDDDK